MKNNKISIIGSGGFALEVFYLMKEDKFQLVGFIDFDIVKAELPLPIIGHEGNIKDLIDSFNFNNCFIAIGDIFKRQNIYNNIKENKIRFPNIISGFSKSFSNDIGKGVVQYPGSTIMNNCRIGNFTIINSGVTIGHDTEIGDFCNINPGVHIAGKVKVGDCTMIGIGSSIKENTKVGSNSIIGAGSVVLNDVPDNTVVYGSPARVRV